MCIWLHERFLKGREYVFKKMVISLTHNLVFLYNRIDGNDHGNNHWQSDENYFMYKIIRHFYHKRIYKAKNMRESLVFSHIKLVFRTCSCDLVQWPTLRYQFIKVWDDQLIKIRGQSMFMSPLVEYVYISRSCEVWIALILQN